MQTETDCSLQMVDLQVVASSVPEDDSPAMQTKVPLKDLQIIASMILGRTFCAGCADQGPRGGYAHRGVCDSGNFCLFVLIVPVEVI